MSRMQVLWLPSRPDGSTPFALVVDQARPDAERDDAIFEFGRDIGAAGVLVTTDTVDLDAAPDADERPVGAPGSGGVPTFAPPETLGAQVAHAVRTQSETRERAAASR